MITRPGTKRGAVSSMLNCHSCGQHCRSTRWDIWDTEFVICSIVVADGIALPCIGYQIGIGWYAFHVVEDSYSIRLDKGLYVFFFICSWSVNLVLLSYLLEPPLSSVGALLFQNPGVSNHLIAVVEHKSFIYSNTILALCRWKLGGKRLCYAIA